MKILIAGDFCPRSRTAELIENEQFREILGEVKPIIEQADYSIVNFETCVATHKDSPIEKCGPNLKATAKALECVKWAGFDCVTLANNHFADYGDKACMHTIDSCNKLNINYLGGGKSLFEASFNLYKEIKGIKVAFINCCEHEFSIATKDSAGANPLDPVQQWYAITEARKLADFVIVIVHGGHEHYQLPSPRMQEAYRFFVDVGADAVINHHQHCYSGYEVYHNKPIFYGLGNFCFDRINQQSGPWTEGFMVELTIEENISFQLFPYIQCANTATVTLMTGEKKANFYTHINELNEVITCKDKLNKTHEEWMERTNGAYMVALSPYNNRYLKTLAYRGWIPSFISRKKALSLLNYIECEAHRDRILNFLSRKLK